jgi:hypothetical protein
MARPKKDEPSIKVEVWVSPKLAAYLDELRTMEGFGESRSGIIKQFVWNEVNKLIKDRRLSQR